MRSNETVGVIFKIEPEAFRILDQAGAIRTLRPSQVGNKLDTRMSVATDKDNYELRAGDMVREAPVGVSALKQNGICGYVTDGDIAASDP